MPILKSNADQSAPPSLPLTIGLGIVFGLFFGLPPAFEIHALGPGWLPFALGELLGGMVVGYSLAFLVVSFLISPTSRQTAVVQPVLQPPRATPPPRRSFELIQTRLAKENATLLHLDDERTRLHAPRFGVATEDRIIWSELLDLELQDIDEQLSRIRHTVDGPA